ncbi:cold-shock protein [Listeria monocytogenes]|uniref:cold-shock protein n=1 Tax=Listeria monocytogenes TaxID=1639 RepID=UPI002FDC21C8
MKTGTVSWFSNKLGYGFITPDDGEKDIFVHYSGVNMKGYKTLEKGERVSYDVVQGEKGPQAENVQRI